MNLQDLFDDLSHQNFRSKSKEEREKISRGHQGKKLTQQHRDNISKAQQGRVGKPCSDMTKSRIGAANGRPVVTPLGEFANVGLAEKAHGFGRGVLRHRIINYPTQFYYKPTDTVKAHWTKSI